LLVYTTYDAMITSQTRSAVEGIIMFTAKRLL